MATPSNWQTPNQSNWLSPSNWQTPNSSYLDTPNSQPPIPSPHGTGNLQNPMTSYYSPNLPPPSQDAGILDPVYMPINVGGVHWVTGAIDLADSIFYVFDSMESETRMLMLEKQVRMEPLEINTYWRTRWLLQWNWTTTLQFLILLQ
ncbi:phospholipase-like protein [Tanacetum coccineum]